MKAFRRMLAMLAVIAIAVSGFAFAEEPALTAQLSEIVTEEVAAEEAAEVVEEPAVEAEEAAERAEEAVEAIDAAEAPEEAAAEEAAAEAEPAAVEDVSVDANAPALMSLFHRDEVPGDCTHPNEWITGEGRWDKEVLAADAKTHTLRYTGEEYYYCPDCGYEYYLPIEGYRETTEEHKWDGDWCWECGYVNPCTHANRVLGYVSKWDITTLSSDAQGHTISCRVQNRYDCPDCDSFTWEEVEGYQTLTEAHDWNSDETGSSYCWVCEYVNTCTHEGKNIEYEGRADEEIVSSDARTHTVEFKTYINFICPLCSYRGWEVSDEVQTVTEPHGWNEGKCWTCGAINSCTHANAVKEPYTGRTNLRVISATAAEHTLSFNNIFFYACPDCDEEYNETGLETVTVTEAHDWYEGICRECESTNSCAHPNRVFRHSGRVALELVSYDETQHTCVFVNRSWYDCPDCGEEMREDDAERFTDTEPHSWWDDRCDFCPAINTCAHEGQFLEYTSKNVLEVLEKTRTTHTIMYMEDYLYMCPDCGNEGWVQGSETKTATEPHDWEDGECYLCDAVNTCTHEKKTEQHTYWETVKAVSSTAVKHILEVRDYTNYICDDCGEQFAEYADTTYKLSGAHQWDNTGYCFECGYRTACTHPNAFENSFYDSYGNAKKVDARTHMVTYSLVESSVCPDCGYSTWKVVSAENRLLNHAFENDVCWICDYALSCSHKNTYTDEVTWYKSAAVKNEKQHTVTRDCFTLTICKDCGSELSRKKTGSETEDYLHYFDCANICGTCGYESSCAHSKKVKESGKDIYAEGYDTASHIVTTMEYEVYLCASCGCELENYASQKIIGTKLEKHSFKNGKCSDCGVYELVCAHEYDANGKCKICGKQQSLELESINLVSRLQLAVGEEYQLEPSLTPANAPAELKYSTSKSSIVSVSKDGLLTAKKAGEATITVRSGDVEASCVVTVVKAPTAIELNRSKLVLRLNDTAQLTAALTPNDACASVLWTSSSFDTVSVDQDGVITARNYGSAVITVTSEINPAVKASCTVEVTDTVSKIELGAEEITLAVKQNYQLAPVMVPEESGVEFSYSSSNAKIASVSKSGKISAVKAGSAVITVTSDTGIEASLNVTVMKAPTKVTISDKKLTVGAGDSFPLSASVAEDCYTVLTWSSSNSKVATVDENGFVTVLKAGKANITVKTHNGKSAKCALTVKAAPESISLSASELVLGEGQDAQLSVILPKNTAARIIWSSDSDAVLVGNGVVTAVKAGTATVYATVANGTVSASCTVTVNPAPTAVVAEDVLLVTGQKYTASAKLQAGDQLFEGVCSVKLASGKGVVTVNEKTGLITAKKAGTAVITLTAYNGVSADCTITVVAAPKSVKLSASKKTLAVGESFELTAKLSPTNAYTDGYTVSVDKEGIISVEGEDGAYTVTAVAAGRAKLTIAASNGKKATCTVTVK